MASSPLPTTALAGVVRSEGLSPARLWGEVVADHSCVHSPALNCQPAQASTVSQVTRTSSTTPIARAAPQGAAVNVELSLSTTRPLKKMWSCVEAEAGAA